MTTEILSLHIPVDEALQSSTSPTSKTSVCKSHGKAACRDFVQTVVTLQIAFTSYLQDHQEEFKVVAKCLRTPKHSLAWLLCTQQQASVGFI